MLVTECLIHARNFSWIISNPDILYDRYYLHFTDKATEAHRDKVTCPRYKVTDSGDARIAKSTPTPYCLSSGCILQRFPPPF